MKLFSSTACLVVFMFCFHLRCAAGQSAAIRTMFRKRRRPNNEPPFSGALARDESFSQKKKEKKILPEEKKRTNISFY